MPVIKGIPCHTSSSRRSVTYAAGENNPKVIARDYINCCERDAMGRNTWQQFDGLRDDRGLNRPRMRAKVDADGNPVLDDAGGAVMYDSTVYYEHYVISPDPKDSPTIRQVREVATEWARREFPGYQVVIGYHNDTGIPHAHVIVNSPSLLGDGRVTDMTRGRGWGRAAWRDLQEIARAHGLSGFRDGLSGHAQAPGGDTAESGALGEPERAGRSVREGAANIRSKAVESLYSTGRYSWVEDIRCRLEVAALMSRDVGQFREECSRLGLEVLPASGGRDWKFAMAAQPSRQVTGRRLGSAWTEFGVGRRLARDRAARVPKPTGESLARLEAAIGALVESGARDIRLLGPEARRAREQAQWRLVYGVRTLLVGAAMPLSGDPFGGAVRKGTPAGEAADRLREAGWPPEGAAPLGGPSPVDWTSGAMGGSRKGKGATAGGSSPSRGSSASESRERTRGAGRSM